MKTRDQIVRLTRTASPLSEKEIEGLGMLTDFPRGWCEMPSINDRRLFERGFVRRKLKDGYAIWLYQITPAGLARLAIELVEVEKPVGSEQRTIQDAVNSSSGYPTLLNFLKDGKAIRARDGRVVLEISASELLDLRRMAEKATETGKWQ